MLPRCSETCTYSPGHQQCVPGEFEDAAPVAKPPQLPANPQRLLPNPRNSHPEFGGLQALMDAPGAPQPRARFQMQRSPSTPTPSSTPETQVRVPVCPLFAASSCYRAPGVSAVCLVRLLHAQEEQASAAVSRRSQMRRALASEAKLRAGARGDASCLVTDLDRARPLAHVPQAPRVRCPTCHP